MRTTNGRKGCSELANNGSLQFPPKLESAAPLLGFLDDFSWGKWYSSGSTPSTLGHVPELSYLSLEEKWDLCRAFFQLSRLSSRHFYFQILRLVLIDMGPSMFLTVYSGSHHRLLGVDSVVWKHETIRIPTQMLRSRREDTRASRVVPAIWSGFYETLFLLIDQVVTWMEA